MRVVVGIDPGVSGGLAALSPDRSYLRTWSMPLEPHSSKGNIVDIVGVRDIFRAIYLDGHQVGLVALEEVNARPPKGKKGAGGAWGSESPERRMGAQSAFNFGGGFYMLRGLVRLMGFPLKLVPPNIWKKSVLSGYGEKSKADTVHYLQLQFPGLDLRDTPRCRKPHEGRVDALAIAIYGTSAIPPQTATQAP